MRSKGKVGLAQQHTVDSFPHECSMNLQALELIDIQIDADKVLANNKFYGI